jgi:hypothetical protein
VTNGEIAPILERIALALERLVEKYAPSQDRHQKKPAILSKALYSREERETELRRKASRGEEPEPPGNAA